MILDRLYLSSRSHLIQFALELKLKFSKSWQFIWRKGPYIGKKFDQDRHLHYQNLLGIPSMKFSSEGPQCVVCDDCRDVCPCACIEIKGKKGERPQDFTIDLSTCVGCALCIDVCPEEALRAYNSFRFFYQLKEGEKLNPKINLKEMKELH